IAGAVSDALGSAIDAVQGFAEGVGNAFGQVGEFIDNVVQWFKDLPGRVADALSSLASTVSNAVSDAVGSVSDYIPGLATGGIVNRDGIYRLAEGGRKEVVIPLTRPRRAQQLADASGLTGMLAGRHGGGDGGEAPVVNVYTNTISPEVLQDKVERALAQVIR